MMMVRKTPKWKRLYILMAFPLVVGAIFVFARPDVDETLQKVVEKKVAASDGGSLNIQVSAADYAGVPADAVVLDVYVNQHNEMLIGTYPKMDFVKQENLAATVSEKLVADFSSRYVKKKDMQEMVACITADRNAKMGGVYEAKQQIGRGYELAMRKLSGKYPAEVLKRCLSSQVIYNPPRAHGNPIARVSNETQQLEGFSMAITLEGGEEVNLKDFTLQELENKVTSLLKEKNASKNVITIGLKVPDDVQEGVVYDVKQVLRKLYLLKVDIVR